LLEEILGRRAKKCHHLGDMRAASVGLKFWIVASEQVASEQVSALENIPNLQYVRQEKKMATGFYL
jgi:hypothetical protein